MKYLQGIFFGLIVFVPLLCHPESNCPWINQATASGILGGPVSVSVENGTPGNAVCMFHFESRNAAYDLQIKVERMQDWGKEFGVYKTLCSSQAIPLQAIGNEAQMCSVNNSSAKHGEQVFGRVRDSTFLVTVSTSADNDPAMTKDNLQEKATLVAEQVAGRLY